MFWKKKPLVITHSGAFHTDDVFAVAALKILLGDIRILRTRKPDDFAKGDYVVDVGGIYDEKANRFDHHQEGGAGSRANGIPYSSFGLVWKKFGEALCGSRAVASSIDEKLVQPIDAEDNGKVSFSPSPEGLLPYKIDDIIDSFNTQSQEPTDHAQAFERAVLMASEILQQIISRAKAREESRAFVDAAYKESPDKRLLILSKNVPRRHMIDTYPDILFVVVPDKTPGQWKVETVRKSSYGYESRKNLPLKWAGKRDDELARITGVPDAVFCHNARFIAAAKSREGAIALAMKALEA